MIFLLTLDNSTFIVDMVLCLICTIAVIALLIVFFRKIPAIFFISGLLLFAVIASILGLGCTSALLFALFVIVSITFAFANISELRHLLIKPTQKNKRQTANYDKAALYKIIDETVHSLSKSKTGAIITFERSTNLDDIMKNGTNINAPVSQELLETIFYEGTRLHDGAVVIRDNMIVAASVYYTPTTRALTGKYGSRHRAAFGISEISDSITVVVSEETGRVAIAYNGNLEPVSLDAFLREFSDLMSLER